MIDPLRIRFWYWLHDRAERLWHWVYREKLAPWQAAQRGEPWPPPSLGEYRASITYVDGAGRETPADSVTFTRCEINAPD